MAVTETLRALGSWGLTFKGTLPDDVWKKIDYFGHIAIHVGRRPGALDDSLLRSARYVGVLRSISDKDAAQRGVGGLGMAMWLGDPDGKGDIYRDPVVVNGDFDDVIRALLPASGSITEGTIFNVAETFSQTFQFVTPREAIDYVCQTLGLAWRVNGDGTLDAGTEADLFTVNPTCLVVRKKTRGAAGFDDMFLRGLAGSAETQRDVEDYTNGVLLLAQGINGQFAQAVADLPPEEILYTDVHGNPVKMTRIIQESETDATNAPARAQLQLNRFKSTRDALTLTTSNYDIKGTAQVGDYLWAYDPAMKLEDLSNEVIFRGERINPFRLRLTETTWPITARMSVFYRGGDGEWLDLTRYVEPETGDTALVVGGYNRALSEGGSGAFPVTPPEADTSVPAQTEWDLPWNQGMYQSPVTGISRSDVELKWFRPDNVDGSTITDGSHYEIRYRPSVTPFFTPTISELANYEVDQLNTVDHPISFGIEEEWQFAQAPFDTLKFRLQELTPGMTYEAQIRAVDSARPPNLGDWSDLVQWQASRDIFPPATPAAPIIASSPMAVLMQHNLGRADGGEFNLDRDLGHLELHAGADPLFTPTNETLVGKVAANWGMISGEVPIVASFQITALTPLYYKVVAVDESGNKSLPSAGVVATAELIADQFVRNLRVDKVTAGTVMADWILGAYIRTGKTGARVELSYNGIDGFNASNEKQLNWDSSTGKLSVVGKGGIKVTGGGNVEITDGALIIYNAAGRKIIEMGECLDGRHGLQVYTDGGTRVARLGELASGSEGMEVVDEVTGQLVRVSTLAFGMRTSSVAGSLTRTSNAYSNGFPQASVTIGNSGNAVIHIGSWIIGAFAAAGLGGGSVGFYGNGPGGATIVADDLQSISSGDNGNWGLGRSFSVTGLASGSWTFGLAYRSNNNTQRTDFINRTISVQPF